MKGLPAVPSPAWRSCHGGDGRRAAVFSPARRRVLPLLLSPLLCARTLFAQEDPAKARAAMVADVSRMAAAYGTGLESERLSERVLGALGKVPRHQFVPAAELPFAYHNRPLPIGHGQTISQPYIVAVMTELAAVQPGARVLEIGTGSGYQAAVLAELGAAVYSIEIVEPLAREARERLARLGYRTVETRVADGYHGWPEHSPFDAILVTAAASHIPPPLVRQLKTGGRMVIPVGAPFLNQQLVLVEKRGGEELITRQLMAVRFVPLVGGH